MASLVVVVVATEPRQLEPALAITALEPALARLAPLVETPRPILALVVVELAGMEPAQLRVVAMAQMAWPLREYRSKPL